MAEMKGSRTEMNLRAAFAAETLANRRYLRFAERAGAEGKSDVAELLRMAAARKDDHAREHVELLEQHCDTGPDRDTVYNLRAAIMSEVQEYSDLYPGMARQARDDGFEDIASCFEILAKATRSHAARLRRALETLM